MEEYNRRYAAALAQLNEKGVRGWSANPPFNRLLRSLGFKPKPPHYAGFWNTMISNGAYFGVVWGALMYAMFWRAQALGAYDMTIRVITAGIVFGVFIGIYFRFSKRKLGLSKWEDL